MGQARYGCGLGREIFEAAKAGFLSQPFDVKACRDYTRTRGWDIPETFMRVFLPNSAVCSTHSPTYRKYFIRVNKGQYKINPNCV